jgi:hypothetical protein
MTVVDVVVRVPSDGGLVAASGSLRWQPTGRRVAGGALILPKDFTVTLDGGGVSVEVEPTDSTWAWMVVEQFAGVPARRRYFTVPESGPVAYTDLVEVAPDSLDVPLSVSPDPEHPGFYVIGV